MNVLLVGLGRWGEKHLRVLTQLGATVWVADVAASRAAMGGRRRASTPERVVADFRDALAARRRGGHRHAGRQPSGPRRGVPGRRAALLRREAARAISAADGRARGRGRARRPAASCRSVTSFDSIPVTATLRAALTAGRIGARALSRPAASAGFKRPRTDVGVTHTDAIHYFDLFAHLLGREATRVERAAARLSRPGPRRHVADHGDYGDVPVIVEANYFVPGTPARVRDRRRARRARRRLRQLHRHAPCRASIGAAGGPGRRSTTGKEELAVTRTPSRCGSSSRRSSPPARGRGPIPCRPRPASMRSRSSRPRRARPASGARSRSPRSAKARVGEPRPERLGADRGRRLSSEILTPASRLNETRSVEVPSFSAVRRPPRRGAASTVGADLRLG